MIIKKINACDKINLVVIKMRLLRQFSTFYFFFMRAFYTHKKHQKAQKALKIQKHKQTHKNANNQTKIKNALKKYLSGKRSLIRLFA